MPISLKGRSFLTLRDFSAEEIRYLLNLAADLKRKKRAGIRGDLLAGKNIVLLFEKISREVFEQRIVQIEEAVAKEHIPGHPEALLGMDIGDAYQVRPLSEAIRIADENMYARKRREV